MTDSVFIYVAVLLLRLKGIIFLPFIIASVGLKYYGVFIQLFVNVKLVTSITHLALASAFGRYTSQYENSDIDRLSRDFWSVIFVGLVCSLVGAGSLYLLCPFLNDTFLDGAALTELRFSSLLVIFNVLQNQVNGYLQARKKFIFHSLQMTIYEFVPYLGFVLLIIFTSSLLPGLLCFIGLKTVIMLVLLVFSAKDLKFTWPNFRICKKFIAYSWPLSFTIVEEDLLSKANRYFIGYFLGPAAIGLYTIIYSVVSLIDDYTVPLRKYYTNYLPKLWDDGKTEVVKRRFREGLSAFLILAMGSLVGIVLYLEPVLNIILGKNMVDIVNMESMIVVLGLGIVTFAVSRFFFQLMIIKGMNHYKLIIQIVAVAVNIGLNYWLLPLLGIMGSAISTLVSYTILLSLSTFFFRIGIDRPFMFRFVRILLSALPMAVPYFFLTPDRIGILLLSMLLSLIIYLGLIIAFRIIKLHDLKRAIQRK